MSIKFALLLFFIGVLLLIVELVIPGFGIFGITGFIMTVYSAYSLLQYTFGFFIIIALTVFAVMLVYNVWKYIKRNGLDKGLILRDNAVDDKKNIGGLDYLVGKIGKSKTPLKPVGMADFNGVSLEVHSDGQYISENKKIKVVSISGNNIIVSEEIEKKSN